MQEWFEELAGQQYATAILWTLAALVGLVILLIIVKLVRTMTGGTFVAGGRNRKTRLAVMDATAVDSNRRLVLVRRDDVEHLILIGGPTDVVVERDIRLGQPRRPAPQPDDRSEAPLPRPRASEPAPPRAPAPPPPQAPQQRAPERIAPQPPQQPPPRPVQREAARPPRPAAPPPAPPRPAPPRNAAVALPPPAPPRPAPLPEVDLDDELLHELEDSFEPPRQQPAPAPQRQPELSLDDEMTKLLGELSNQKK